MAIRCVHGDLTGFVAKLLGYVDVGVRFENEERAAIAIRVQAIRRAFGDDDVIVPAEWEQAID